MPRISKSIQVQCVKARDFELVESFKIAGRPYIDENHDFALRVEPGQPPEQAEIESLIAFLKTNPEATYPQVSGATGISTGRLKEAAANAGWTKQPGATKWTCVARTEVKVA